MVQTIMKKQENKTASRKSSIIFKNIFIISITAILLFAFSGCSNKNASGKNVLSTLTSSTEGKIVSNSALSSDISSTISNINSNDENVSNSSNNSSISSNSNIVNTNSKSPTITLKPTTKPQITSTATSQLPTNIVFNDAVLEELIRQCVNKPSGQVTIKDWDALGYSAIYIRTTRIDNSTIIELIDSKLIKPDLFKSVSGQISNFSVLRQLPNIKNLSIIYMKEVPGASNIKFDINQITGIKNLEGLSFFMTITNNQPITHKFDFSNFSNIIKLNTLTYLRINSAINVDAKLLSGMKNIQTLQLVDCAN